MKIGTRYYAAAGVLAIGALVAGGALWWARDGAADCGASMAGAEIGGPFELVAEDGSLVTEREVIDRPALVYFGYTFCPDICPFDVARNAEAADLLAERGVSVKPVFVSVDPQRDTPEVLTDYTDWVHPEMLGLTGSEEQVRAAADAYRVYYRAEASDDPAYLVDHTTFTYLMMPEDGLVDFFRRDLPAEAMADRVACHLGA